MLLSGGRGRVQLALKFLSRIVCVALKTRRCRLLPLMGLLEYSVFNATRNVEFLLIDSNLEFTESTWV